jgi:hypothetical protein
MALSNWDTLAFDEKGKSCNGIFDLRGDAKLDIYKNWIYIEHPSAWFEDCMYGQPTVMEIQSGEINYAGCYITVIREDLQSACFVYASDRHYGENTHRCFAGIGCYGYVDDEFVGVTPKLYELFIKWLANECDNIEWIIKVKEAIPTRFNQGDAFLSNKIGFDVDTTQIGDANDTLLSKLFGG